MDGFPKVLLVEEDLEHANHVKANLLKFNPDLEIETAASYREFMENSRKDQESYQVIVLDSDQANAETELRSHLRKNRLPRPVILVSDFDDEEAIVDILKSSALEVAPGEVYSIPEHKPPSLALNANQEWLRKLLDGVDELVCLVNANYEIVDVNQPFADFLDLEPEDIVGRQYPEVASVLAEACEVCPVKETFDTGEARTVQVSRDDKFFEIRTRLFGHEDSQAEAVAVYTRDITENAKLHQSIIQSEKLSAMGLLTSGIVHEIRNPLNVIETARYFLEEIIREPSPEIRDKLRIIQNNVQRASKIIRNLLDFARDSKYDRESINLTRLIQNTISLLGKDLTARDIKFVFKNAEDKFAIFNVDSLKQALLNLIMNAIQAMPNGGTLEVSVDDSSDCTSVAIRDSGMGIPPENLPHIFDPFFTTKEEDVGTGLGLYISKMILEREGGSIQVASTPKRGTTFTIFLPGKENKAS